MAIFFKLIIAGGLPTMFTQSRMVVITTLLSSLMHQRFLVRLKSKLKDLVDVLLLSLFLMKTATPRFELTFITVLKINLGTLCIARWWPILDGLFQGCKDVGCELLSTRLDVWPVSSYERNPGVGKFQSNLSFSVDVICVTILSIFSRSLSPVTG